LSKDGPLAMILWGIGAALAILSFFVPPRAIALSVAAILANLIPLCGVAAVLLLLGHSTLIWH
jgi:AhpD family alkylhydroperoxidase